MGNEVDSDGGSGDGAPVTSRADERDEAAGHGGDALPQALPDEVPFPPTPSEAATTGLPRRLEAWRRRSAAGAVFTGMAFGLREVFEPPTNEPAVVLETSGTPPKDLPVEAELDDAPARHTVVRIRPWLLDDAGADAEAAGADRPARELVAPPRKARPRSRRQGRRA